jgi:hypothetical protein
MSAGEISETRDFDAELGAIQKRALFVGAIGAVLFALLGMRSGEQFFRSYLLAYVFWVGLPLGSLGLLMLHHLTGGGWGFVIRRVCEASSRTFPLMAVLFVPIVIGMPHLFPWAQPEWAQEAHAGLKGVYLNRGFFLVRAVFYFATWTGLSTLLSRWSLDEDSSRDPGAHSRMENLSAPGLILYGFTATFAVIDWVMSLQPHWFSTIFGMIFIVIQVLSAMAFSIVVTRRLSDRGALAAVASPGRFQDLGNLLFTFVMLWAYLSFSQFLLIWSGNVREEIPWYLSRMQGAWAGMALFLILFHFAIPFLLLLNRPLKRRKAALATIAGALLLVTFVDVFWMVVPAFLPQAPVLHAGDLLGLFAIGGFWVWAFAGQLRGKPLVPLGDARLEEAPEHGH